jgi:hypothetical protein
MERSMLISFAPDNFLGIDNVCLDVLQFGTSCEMRFPSSGGVQDATATRKRYCFSGLWLECQPQRHLHLTRRKYTRATAECSETSVLAQDAGRSLCSDAGIWADIVGCVQHIKGFNTKFESLSFCQKIESLMRGKIELAKGGSSEIVASGIADEL